MSHQLLRLILLPLLLLSFSPLIGCEPVADEADGGISDAQIVGDVGGDLGADIGGDAQIATDTGVVPDVGADAETATDTGVVLDVGPVDAAGDAAVEQPSASAVLLVEDQTLAAPFDSLTITAASLPEGSAPAVIKAYYFGGALDGTLAGRRALNADEPLENAPMALDAPIVGTHLLVAQLLDASDEPILGADGEPVAAEYTVVGDMEDPELFVADQLLDSENLYGVTITQASVPARYTVGVWVAIYEDDEGALGALRGKVQLQAGDHEGVAFDLSTRISKSRTLHAVMREGRPGSGSWSSNNPMILTLTGQIIASEFTVDNEVFRPVLEVEDQEITTTATGTSQLVIKTVTIPQEYLGGGWVAIYADDAGAPGAFMGKLYYSRGNRTDRTLSFDEPQAGDATLHAKLHVGQMWADAADQVMQDSGGHDMWVTFRTGARELNYILSPPQITPDPRHVIVQRAYSFDKSAWVVLARDDNGQPGTILARKKVLRRFAGNVHIHDLYGDFEDAGNSVEYLTAEPGTYRRYVRGHENLHVLLYEDDPADNEFTYVPGGDEDVPVLDSAGQPVVARIDVTVRSAILNVQKDSPRYYAPCPLSQHISNPTPLPVDCRCHANVVGLDFPECKNTIANFLGMQFGDGPRAYTHGFGGFRSGFSEAETNSLVGLLVWKDPVTRWPENDTTLDVGAVIRIDLETRGRTIISGRYEDPENGILDVGTGPVLSYPFGLQKGPNGIYYVASYGYTRIGASLTPTVDIISVDPATGDRAYVWRSNHLGFNRDNQPNPYGHCGNGRTEQFGYFSVQIGRKAFAIGPDGTFYLSYAHNGNTPTSNGIGILKIGADGSTCGFVTRTKVGADNVLYHGQSIGAGVEPQAGPYNGMLVRDGKLYTSTVLGNDLYEVDIATGDRTAVHVYGVHDNNRGSSGTHVVWDRYRNLIWQAGLSGATLLYDPENGTSEPLWCAENDRDYRGIACLKIGAWGNNGMPVERGLWMHPTDGDYMFVINGPMIQRVHLPSGTSDIFSY